jgi:hypothetical protein
MHSKIAKKPFHVTDRKGETTVDSHPLPTQFIHAFVEKGITAIYFRCFGTKKPSQVKITAKAGKAISFVKYYAGNFPK